MSSKQTEKGAPKEVVLDYGAYDLRDLKQMETERGMAFNATITRVGGRPVGTVMQEGRGGCNIYHFDRPAWERIFRNHARRAMVASGLAHPGSTEVEDWFVERLIRRQELREKLKGYPAGGEGVEGGADVFVLTLMFRRAGAAADLDLHFCEERSYVYAGTKGNARAAALSQNALAYYLTRR